MAYAASDAMWRGIEDVPGVGGLIAERWARREGPVKGPVSVFAAMLASVWHILHAPTPDGFDGARSTSRTLARRLLGQGLLDAETAQAAFGWRCLT